MTEPIKPRTQTEALAVLARLAAEGAPPVEWTITTGDGTDRLQARGLMFTTGPDLDRVRRVGLATWQRIIGAGPVTTSRAGAYERLAITGSYEGLPVRVSTMLPSAMAGEAA
ncbi:hypothetical protein [Nocardiopsis dassonvillei]|uniref:hypothetical protein n=1 Tax=Nocardiopsis dassonvillei TaxID=2014 RepID=UPI00364066B7